MAKPNMIRNNRPEKFLTLAMSFPIRPESQNNPIFPLSRIPPVPSAERLIAGFPLQGNVAVYSPQLSPGAMLTTFGKLDMLMSGKHGKSRTDAIQVRWDLPSMPLGIYIEGDSAALAALLMEQAAQWENNSVPQGSTSPLIRFQRLHSLSEVCTPDILIKIAGDTVSGRENETGHTDRVVDAKGYIRQVTITLVERPVVYASLNEQEQKICLQATLLHELGHALGLEHSQHKTDAMYYRGWRNTVVSQGDRSALLALYARPESFLA